MTSFSWSEIRRLFRSGPAINRAIASSSSSIPITFWLARAARIAASLMRLARSAPLNPGVWRARTSRSTVVTSGLFLGCTSRSPRRALMVGPGGGELPVKPAGPQQGWVEHVGPVGRGDHDDVGVRIETVHFHE